MTTIATRRELNLAYNTLYRANESHGHLLARQFTRSAADHLRLAGALDLADQAEYGLDRSIGHPFNTGDLMTQVDRRLTIAEFTSY